MPIYSYEALKNNTDKVKGKVEAENLRAARDQIKQLGLIPIKIEEDNPSKTEQLNLLPVERLRPLSLKEKIDFSSTYQTLVGAGVAVVESLVFMEEEASSANIRNLAKALRRNIIAGATFADTVKRYGNYFGQLFVGLTKAGEDSGEMETTMARIIELLRKQEAVKSKVSGALIYPGFVIFLAAVVSVVMLTFVFPKFSDIFAQTGKALPPITQFCIDAGAFLTNYWYAAILMTAALCFGVYYLFKWPTSRNIIDTFSLKIPLIGNLLKFGAFSNYLAVLQVAYDAGVPIVNSMSLAVQTVENVSIRDAMSTAKNKVQQGLHLSMALKSTGVMPKMLLFMIQTGEQSGKLGAMLEQAVRFVDKELDKFVEKMTKAIEPIMLLVLGALVLFYGLALYLPLFGMMQPA